MAQAENAEPVAFKISVDPKLIDEAKLKAKLYRPSIPLEDGASDTWLEGPPPQKMTALAKYWAEEFDWYQFQDELNAGNNHYKVTVPGVEGYDHPVPLHFVHERSARPDAIPLLMLHGWTSTHHEWASVTQSLVSPADDGAPAFHVVAPDWPGAGFSPAPRFQGMGPREGGRIFGNLMKTLGYTKYGIVTTDAGWFAGMWMVEDEAEHIIGHLTDFYMAQPTPADLERLAKQEADEDEIKYVVSLKAFQDGFASYMPIQSQHPLKLGQALTDSPVGFAGWIWHHLEINGDGRAHTFQELVTRAMLLWIPGAYGNLRLYTEFLKPGTMEFPKTDVPTGVSEWGLINGPFKSLAGFPLAPRSWIERHCNVQFFVRREFGGHYPAENHPDLYVQDLQAFFGSLKA